MPDNNDLGLIPDSGATATMSPPHTDLGLIPDKPAQPAPVAANRDQDLGLVHDLPTSQLKKDSDELGIQGEHGDIFAGPKQEWYSPAVRGVENAADEFMGYFNKQAPTGIAERIAKPGVDNVTPRQEAEGQENPGVKLLAEAAGSAATFSSAATIPEVSLPVAFGAASVMSGVADQADKIKDANEQLTLGQRIGKIGVDAVAGAITGRIFSVASQGDTILDRVIERSGGAGATAISQSLANQAVEGKEPDAAQAVAAGGLQAVAIGIVGGMAEVPALRGLVMDQAKQFISKDGTVMGNTGPYKVDPDNLTIDQAKKILTDSTINPEHLAPEYQQAQYDIKKQIAMDNLDAKSKQYGVDPDIMKQVLNAQGQRAREGILQDYLTSMIKTDPKTASKLLPFFESIKQGADPADIIIMSDMLAKFNSKVEVSQTVGENANAKIESNAAAPGEAAAPPAGENEQGAKLPLSQGNEKAGPGDTSQAQAIVTGPAAGGGPGQSAAPGGPGNLIKTPIQLSDDDHKDIKNLMDWESNMPNGEKWSFINSSGDREFGGTPSGHSEAMQTVGPKESMRLLQKASNGDKLTVNQQAAVKHLLADYQTNIKPHLEGAKQEIDNVHKTLSESGASEASNQTADSFKSEAPTLASAWEEHAQGTAGAETTPSGQLRHELQAPIPGSLFQEPGELFEKDKDLGVQNDEPKYRTENPQEQTPAFKGWFGESKVTDDQGKPLVVFSGHSNSAKYGAKYKPQKGTAGGFYATEDPQIASNYANGKFGNMENTAHGSEYGFKDTKGNYTKKLSQIELTEKQKGILTDAKNEMNKYGDSVYHLKDMDRWIKEMQPYDRQARYMQMTGGSSNLQNIHDWYEQMGYTIRHWNDDKDKPEFERFENSDFDDLLDKLGLDWTSHWQPRPGVMPIYLSIKNPIDADKPFPPDLLKHLQELTKRRHDRDDSNVRWTKDYPLKEWVKRIAEGDEYWTTQIPSEAVKILKSYGYDGIKERGLKGSDKTRAERQVNWIAFDATQIKSAIGNKGTFDSTNPDMRFKSQPTWNYLLKDKEEYAKANKEGLALIEKYLPQLKDSLVNPAFIATKDGARAIGAYYRGRIYVKTGAGLNVYVHEMGHAVFDLFLTPEEKASLLAEGRKIYGNDADVEERIMLDFEQYAKDQRFIPDNSIWGKLRSFFKSLQDRLLKFIGVNPVSIKSFYDAILGGEFRESLPRKDYETQGQLSGSGNAPVYKKESEEFKGPSAFDPAIQAVAKLHKEVISLLAPRMLVPRESLDMIMKMKGERDKLEFVLENRLKDLEKTFDNMTREEQLAFVDRIKTGVPQSTPALQQVANMMHTVEDKYWAQAKEFKPSLAYKENHFRVMWKVIPGSPESKGFHGLFRKPFQGTQGWAKKSTLADMSEGIKAGGVPYSYNPVTMWKNSIMDMQKFITARRMWNNLKTMGMVKYIRAGEKTDPGMVMVDDRISHVYLPIEATPIGSESSFNANLEVGKYYVEEASGRILNNFLGRDYIRESTIGGGLLAFKNFTTGIELSLSPFHAAYTTLMASSSNIGLGLQKIANRGLIMGEGKAFLEGLADIAHGLPFAGSARYFDLGTKAINYLSKDEFVKSKAGQDFIKAFPDAAQLLDDLFMGGGALAQHQDYKITALKAFTQGIRNFGDAKRSFMVAQANKDSKLMQKYALEMANNAWAEVIHLLPSVNQMVMAPLFQVYIPRLKIGAFLSEYSNDLVARRDQLESGRLTRAQLARETWDSVERRFGEMNFDNLFWNRNFKTSLQLVFRSVTWKIGALQNIGGAGTGTIKDLAIAVQDKALPKLNRNLAMILGLALMVTVFAEVMQKLLTGKNLGQRDDGKEDLGLLFKDMMDPRYNAKGDRLFFNTHLKDWAHLFHSPGGFIANSTSGFIGRVIEDWNNKDFFNTQIHNPHDPAYKQFWDMLVHLMPLPFMITNQYQLKVKGAPAVVRAMTMAGFTTPAPGYVNDTPVLSLAQQLMKDKPFNNVTHTAAQTARYQFLNTLKQGYAANGDPNPIHDAERAGKITFKQALDLKKEARMSPLQRIATSKQMNFDDVSQLMQKAIQTKSVDEQNILWPIVREKYFHAMEHALGSAGSEDQRADLKAVYNDIRTKIGK